MYYDSDSIVTRLHKYDNYLKKSEATHVGPMCYNIIQLSADDVILHTEEYLYSAHIQATPVRL